MKRNIEGVGPVLFQQSHIPVFVDIRRDGSCHAPGVMGLPVSTSSPFGDFRPNGIAMTSCASHSDATSGITMKCVLPQSQ